MRIALLVLLVGCATDPAAPPDDMPDPNPDPTDPTDGDADGIPDELEDQLMVEFGPILRLAPDDIDWTRPATVDWYLPQVHMRFDQSGCPDDALLDVGAVTFETLSAQHDFLKRTGTGLCAKSDKPEDERFSNTKALEFFLQAVDDNAVHPGIPPARKDEWRAYIQVRPSGYVRADGVAAAYDLQVWYFFAYNDFVATANHEADWEHMTISITEDRRIASVYLAAHDGGARFDDLSKLQLVDGHVVGYIADGSHATYESPGAHAGPVFDDHTYDGGPTWETYASFVNVGDVGHELNGQTWTQYGGRWGEVGETSFTSGPPTPTFQGTWNTANEY